MAPALTLAPMALWHIAEVAALERLCFSEPWSEQGLYAASAADGGRFVVALAGDRVVGYAGMSTVLDEGYIANVAAHPAYRRRGVGRALMRELARIAGAMGLSFITLEVRVSNAAAIALYAGEGFAPDGLRPGYYDCPKEDALIMTRRMK